MVDKRILMSVAAAVCAGLTMSSLPVRAEFYWEGLLPFVRADVELTVRGLECRENCPRQTATQGRRPPPLPGEGILDWLGGDGNGTTGTQGRGAVRP